MKKAKRITAFLLALTAALTAPFSAYAFTSKSIFTSSTYTHQNRFSSYTMQQGVDVSNHNGTVNWAKVKAAGVNFAVLRVGCRGWASEGTLLKDTKFEEYIEGASKQGLDIGVYFYSQALNKAEAKEEANFVLKYIKSYKSKINLPVYFDYEFASQYYGRLDSAWRNGSITKTTMTNNAKAFCNVIEENGFRAGIYASKYFYYDNLNYTDLEDKYDIWLAHYATSTDYKGNFSIWQFSEKGSISGISGNVDSNFMYLKKTFDDVAIAKQAYTGTEIIPEFDVKYKNTVLRKGIDYYVTFSNNVNYGTASVTVTGVNGYQDLKPKTYAFEIVPSAIDSALLTKRESTALSAKWEASPEAEGYLVRYYGPNGGTNAGETTATSYKITGLAGATVYGITVSAYKTVNGKKYYGLESEATKAVTKPVKVKGLKTAVRTNNSIKLKWTKQIGATSYLIYRYNTETKQFESIGSTAANSFTVNKLKANTAYRFKVKAATINETGEEMYGVFSQEYTDYTAPKTPKLKWAKSKSAARITAKWKAVSGATGYQVMWSTTSGFTKNKKSVKVTGVNKTTVKTARSGGSYYIRVRAYVKRNGKTYYSSWSNAIHVYTK